MTELLLEMRKEMETLEILIPDHALFPAKRYLRNMDCMGILSSLFFILQ